MYIGDTEHFNLLIFYFYFMCIDILPRACEGVSSSGIGLIDSCYLLDGLVGIEPKSFTRLATALICWAISPGPPLFTVFFFFFKEPEIILKWFGEGYSGTESAEIW